MSHVAPGAREKIVLDTFAETARLHERLMKLDPTPILAGADAITAALDRGGKVLACGNGGSAADAQHFCAELVGRFLTERRPLPAIALSTDTSVLTSIANDYGFDAVFSRQVEALGRDGDVMLGISTGGHSPNVLAAMQAAMSAGLRTIALTGYDGGPIGAAAQIHIKVPDSSVPRVQEGHRTILHVLCDLIERSRDRSTP